MKSKYCRKYKRKLFPKATETANSQESQLHSVLKSEIPTSEEISKACHKHVKVKGEGTILVIIGVRLEDFSFIFLKGCEYFSSV